MKLTTKRLTLRAPLESDIPHIFEATQFSGFNDGMKWEPPLSEAELQKPFENNLKSWAAGEAYAFSIVETRSDIFMGRIVIRFPRVGVANIGFWTHPTHQRKGVMSEAVAEIVRFAFEDFNVTEVEASHTVWNIGSEKTLKANGFQFVKHKKQGFKKLDIWVPENVLTIYKSDWEKSFGRNC